MKITRYFQSCLLIEDGGTRLLVDPSGNEKDNAPKLGKLDAVIYTHEHSDHFDPELAEQFAGQGTPIYANASTAGKMKSRPNVVTDGQGFKVGAIDIKVIELPHCPMPDGSAGPQNSGYLIEGKLFHPGDGKELAGLKVDNLAVPMLGPDVSVRDACDFAKQVGAKNVIPIHYDSFGAKPDFLVMASQRFNMPFEVWPLANGESTEI